MVRKEIKISPEPKLKGSFKGDGTFGKSKNGSLIVKGKVPPLANGTFKKKI